MPRQAAWVALGYLPEQKSSCAGKKGQQTCLESRMVGVPSLMPEPLSAQVCDSQTNSECGVGRQEQMKHGQYGPDHAGTPEPLLFYGIAAGMGGLFRSETCRQTEACYNQVDPCSDHRQNGVSGIKQFDSGRE